MNEKQIVSRLNEYCEDNEIYNLDGLMDCLKYDNPQSDLKIASFTKLTNEPIYHDEHRWYTVFGNVFSFIINEEEIKLAVFEVGSIKSEIMVESDCGYILNFSRVEPYTTISYRVKEEN